MNIIEILTKPIHLMSADELLLAIPASLFIFVVSVLSGAKIIDRITSSWRDTAPEDETAADAENQPVSVRDLLTREDLAAVVNARMMSEWLAGLRETYASLPPVQLREMQFEARKKYNAGKQLSPAEHLLLDMEGQTDE